MIEVVTVPGEPRAEYKQVGRWTWQIRVADSYMADGRPFWRDHWTCFTKRGAVRSSSRWLRRARWKRGFGGYMRVQDKGGRVQGG